MNFLSFSVAGLVVVLSHISILGFLNESWKGGFTEWLILALVLVAGTESTNILIKYFGYVKDARKQPSEVEVLIVPSPVTVNKGATLQFLSVVKNTDNSAVDWSVLQSTGGTINTDGLYTASQQGGTYQVMAKSKADPTKFFIASINRPIRKNLARQ